MQFQLTDFEAKLAADAEILLAKNNIIKKVIELFGSLSQEFVNEVELYLPRESLKVGPKVSRGENYLGLPYVMLDYPRNFSKEDVFAIRTFFWWGNFFSITLQLQGRYKDDYLQQLLKAVDGGKLTKWYQVINENPWHHHFDSDNVICVGRELKHESLPFIKLAIKIPLTEWEHASEFLLQNFRLLLSVLKI